jgi:hypothetical protein
MNKLEFLKNEIAKLPPSMLVEVEGFVRKKKKEMIVEVEGFVRKKKREMKSRQKPPSLLSDLAECAIEDNLPVDLAKQHDHYLYGTPKK